MSGTTSGLANLPTPAFVNDADGLNPLLILNDMIASFQAASNRTLYPAQVERLLINLYAYRETLVRNAIQSTGLQNLLAFAVYPILDYLGQLVSTPRLSSQSATCTLQFTLLNALTVAFTLPQGTQVGTQDGAQIFATSQPLTFPAGTTVLSIASAANSPGAAANGYLAGQVSILIGGNALIASVTNTNTTGGGFDQETDDHYRTRIQAAPNKFSVAGPSGAYRFFALTANSSIVDVQVNNPVPGTVSLVVLTGPITQPTASPSSNAIASIQVQNEVLAICSADTVRPICDTVTAAAVTEVDYTMSATITYFQNAVAATLEAAANEAAQLMQDNLAASIGQDLVPSQWVAALSVGGVYEVVVTFVVSIGGITQGLRGDGGFTLSPPSVAGFWANCTAVSLTFVQGTELTPP